MSQHQSLSPTVANRERRARRRAAKGGLVLIKSRRDNPYHDLGQYWLVLQDSRGLIYGGQWGCFLEEAEEFLADCD